MAVYKTKLKRNFGPITDTEKLAGQIMVDGTDPTIKVSEKGGFFIEAIQASSGTIVVTDGSGEQVMPAVGTTFLDLQHSPVFCIGGASEIIITGSVAIVKGFVLEGILP